MPTGFPGTPTDYVEITIPADGDNPNGPLFSTPLEQLRNQSLFDRDDLQDQIDGLVSISGLIVEMSSNLPGAGDRTETVDLSQYRALGYSHCRILAFPSGGGGAGGSDDHSGGGGGSGFPVVDTISLENDVDDAPDFEGTNALALSITIGPPGEGGSAGGSGTGGSGDPGGDIVVECTANGYILTARGGLNGTASGTGGNGGNGGGGGRDTTGSARRGGQCLSSGETGSSAGGIGMADALPGSTGSITDPCGASFLGGYNSATDDMYGGGGGGGFWKRDATGSVTTNRQTSGVGYGAGGNGGKSEAGDGKAGQNGRRGMLVLIFTGGTRTYTILSP